MASHFLCHSQSRFSSPGESANIIRGVLEGKSGPARDIVLLNAAAALVIGGVAKDLAAGIAMATDAVDSGAASKALHKLVTISQAEK